MLIGVDIDDVLADLVNPFTEFHNRTYGTSLTKENFIHYALWQVIGGTHEEDLRKMAEFEKTTYYSGMKPITGAISAIEILAANHNLIVITSRTYYMMDSTQRWINNHFPNKFQNVHFAQNYQGTGLDKKKKSEIVSELKVDFLIEDNFDYAAECARQGVKTLLFNQPWNQTHPLPRLVYRVYSWQDILHKLSHPDFK